MLISLSLPVLILAGGVTGVPGLNWLKGLKLRRPPPAPADTLPPAWKTPSRLALEPQLLRVALPPLTQGALSLKVASDPRRLSVGFDPDSGLVTAVPELGEVRIGQASRQLLSEYSDDLTRRSFQRQWYQRNAEYIRSQSGEAQGTGARASPAGLSFKLPSPLPRQVQSLLGPGGPALNISGSENIRLSGQSNWTNLRTGSTARRPSLFPSLDMQQDLDIRLEGQLSDRVRVNLLQNSGIQIPLANRIAINYKGEEDDLVQALDLGNTNLSLPGTQYVSYSGKNEGLFGVKSSLRIGPLDFSILASRQEGRSERASYHGGASNQRNTLADLDYVKGFYFYLYDPNEDVLQIQNSDIALYLDDFIYSNDQNSTPGRAFVDTSQVCGETGPYGDPQICDTTSVRGTFTKLYPVDDYEVLDLYSTSSAVIKVIRLLRQVSGDQRLAVTYKARRVYSTGLGPEFEVGQQDTVTTPEVDGVRRKFMKLLRAPASIVKPNPVTGFFTRDSLFARTRDLELKNFYQLPGQRIDPTSFKLAIRRGVDDPPITSILVGAESVPYLEVLGLDSFDQSGGGQVRGHDGAVDGTYLNPGSQQTFVDYENGILFFPDPQPFAPRIGQNDVDGNPLFRFDQAVSNILLRRDSLVGGADADLNSANVAIYDKYNVQRNLDSRYYIDVDFTAARSFGEINLGRGSLLEGSEVVSINGQALVRDRDYTIDYDTGKVTMKRQPGPADQLNIDYSYAPLFQQAGRTLIGNAFRMEGRDKSFGGAFMYESKGAQDLRPRLGEEPSRSLIGDLNTAWSFRPEWVTRLVDRLPGVRTTSPSELNVQAEVGASFPNPNTKNVVYIDDMEGVRDAVSLSMDAQRWTWGSPPSRTDGVGNVVPILADTIDGQHNAEIHWFTPLSGAKERDLKPNLTDAEGAQTSHPSMALSIPRRPVSAVNTPGSEDTLWAALAYPLDPVGIDLSRAQFIEVWVNDFRNPSIRDLNLGANRGMKLHIDLGVVSEDQMRSPDRIPNTLLDTEDRAEVGDAPDRQLDVRREDTGYDRRFSAEEVTPVPPRDLVTVRDGDPEGDDYDQAPEGTAPEELNPVKYLFTNGTEDNHEVNPVPDTEDLNLDNNLQRVDECFQYTIPLCDTCSTYRVTNVYEDFANATPRPAEDNGWRRYRIPITDPLRGQFGVPDLVHTRHVRLWVEGVMEPDPAGRPLLMLGGLEIVGSRWQSADLTKSQEIQGTKLTLNSLNTVDNAGEYKAPFDPGSERSGGQAVGRREQSLALEFENLLPEDTLEVFKTFSIDEDYSRYGQLTWFVGGLGLEGYTPGVSPVYYFVRFASDEQGRNYYEYKARVPQKPNTRFVEWNEIKQKLTDLSNLKLAPDFPLADPILYKVSGPQGSDTLTVRGRPSFTRLRRISFGVINQQTDPDSIVGAGKILLDEMRAIDIAKDDGYAQRMQVNGHLSNLLSYNFSWNGRDANFQSVGESRGVGSTSNQFSAGTSVDLHRFFEGTGIVLPVSLSYGRSTSRPRFTAGDDVIRTGALEAASETRNESRGLTTSYSRQWSERSNPILRYTLGGIGASYSRSESDGRNPTTVTSSRGQSASVNYGISPRSLLVVGLPATKMKFYPLPERAYWNYSVSTSEAETFDRRRDGSGLVLRNAVTGRTAFINFGADTRPFEILHHHFEGVRNLTLPDAQLEKLGFVNLGRVVTWRQSMDARYSLNRGPWLSPTLDWSSSYNQDNRPELSKDLAIRSLGNGQSLNASWALPFDRLQPVAPRRAPTDTGATATKRPAVPVWRGLVSRLGAVAAQAGYNQSSSYSRLLGTSQFLYLLGVSDNPGLEPNNTGRMRDTTGNTIGKAQDWRANARTRLSLPVDASISMRGEYSWRRSEQNRVATRTATSRFPDLEVEYGRLPTTLQLNRLMSNPRLRTNYSRSRDTQYRIRESSPSSIGTTSQWQPLIGINGELKNQTRVELKIERRVTVRENREFGSSTRTDRNTDLNLSLNRSYSRGQKVKILGRESTVKSTVQLGLTGVYSRSSGGMRKAGQTTDQQREDRDRLSVNGTGSYSFSNNVTGSLVLGFGQNRDMVLRSVSRNVRLELRAAFTF